MTNTKKQAMMRAKHSTSLRFNSDRKRMSRELGLSSDITWHDYFERIADKLEIPKHEEVD